MSHQRRRHTVGSCGAVPLPMRFVCATVAPVAYQDRYNARIVHQRWRAGAAVCATWSDDGAIDYDELVTDDREGLLAWIERHGSRRENVWLWTCRTVEWMQLTGFMHSLSRDYCRVLHAVIGDPPTSLRLRLGGRRFVLADTRNFTPGGLEDLAEYCCLRMPALPLLGCTDADAAGHARSGAWSILHFAVALRSLAERAELGGLSSTLGSCAWRWYRHAFMSRSVEVHCCGEALRMERESYHGGDVIVGHVGPAPRRAYHLDVNSLYPSVMADAPHPTRLDTLYQSAKVGDIADALQERCVIARVEMDDCANAYPMRRDGLRVDSCGRYWTCLAGPELRLALSNGSVARAGQMATYQSGNLFGEWSEYWWSLRLRAIAAGDALVGKIAKAVANALSGRWAMRSPEWVPVGNVLAPVPIGEWWEVDATTGARSFYLAIGRKVLRRSQRGEGAESFPAVASYITSAGRVRMRALRCLAGEREVYYQDTDSLFVSALGLSRLSAAGEVRDGALGRLRLIAGPKTLDIAAPRVYNYGGEQTASGLDGQTAEDDGSVWRHRVGERGRSVLTHSADMTTHETAQTYRVSGSAGTRLIGPDGWTSAPTVGVD